jgi:hypothetical protein
METSIIISAGFTCSEISDMGQSLYCHS